MNCLFVTSIQSCAQEKNRGSDSQREAVTQREYHPVTTPIFTARLFAANNYYPSSLKRQICLNYFCLDFPA